ncbi:MAG: integration host factor subunit alpha [Magnetococcales bacterium]|nr:integration host factor subunit alpha [Magnetococcales bacterium]MBF0116903.1 integration host factor subunit alpha [Magnetococcales bacterium]
MDNTLTKADLAESVRIAMAIPKKDAAIVVDTILETVRIQLENGESVKLSGFGHFSIRNKHSRSGRNPKTGETCEISARKVLTFNPSTLLKARVIGNQSDTATG